MKSIHSPRDFEEALQTERAAMLVFFAWSRLAGQSRQVVEHWETVRSSQTGSVDFPIYLLEPDHLPYTWKWLGAAMGQDEGEENAHGLVLWLRHGSVIARVPNAALAGVNTLAAMTDDCFGLGPNQTSGDPDSLATRIPKFDAELLKVLCCPETHQELKLAGLPMLEKLGQLLAAGRLKNRAGCVLNEKIDGALIRTDGRYIYPLRQGIPILLVEEGIPVTE